MKSRNLIVAALGLAGALCTGAAMAHGNDDIQWSVTVGSDYGAPQYYRPAPVYVQPAYPAPVYGPHHYRQPTRWDVDGDGIPNRYDRLYNPAWDRDGDGIPDWRERHGERHYDRDYERHDDRYDYRRGWGR